MAKAAVTRSIRDDHQKNFLKIFNGLTGKHSRWEIWEDFVTLTAIEISNSTDKVNATERTKMYQTIISGNTARLNGLQTSRNLQSKTRMLLIRPTNTLPGTASGTSPKMLLCRKMQIMSSISTR